MFSYKLNTVLFLFLIPGKLIFAQDWKKDLLAMNKTYIEAKSFQMNIEIKSFAKTTDAQPMMFEKGKVAFSNGNSYSEMAGKSTLLNKKCMVVVDKKQKIILYKKLNSPKSNAMSGFSLAQIDSAIIMFGKNVNVSYVVNTDKQKVLSVKYSEGNIDRIEITINPTNNTLTKMVYYYNTKEPGMTASVEKVEIDFKNILLNTAVAEATFSENKYIEIKNGKMQGVASYSKYEIVNQDEVSIQ